MNCEKHKIAMFDVNGKFFCPHCLAEKRREVVRYPNPTLLSSMPVGLRNCRLSDFRKNTKGDEFGFITGLRKLSEPLHEQDFEFNVVWLSDVDPIETTHLLAAVCNERLLAERKALYLNLSERFSNDVDERVQVEHQIRSNPLIVLNLSSIALFSMALSISVRDIVLSAVENNQIVVIGSQFTVERFMQEPHGKYALKGLESIIKEVKVNAR